MEKSLQDRLSTIELNTSLLIRRARMTFQLQCLVVAHHKTLQARQGFQFIIAVFFGIVAFIGLAVSLRTIYMSGKDLFYGIASIFLLSITLVGLCWLVLQIRNETRELWKLSKGIKELKQFAEITDEELQKSTAEQSE